MNQIEILKIIQSLANPTLDIFFQGATILGEELIHVVFFSFFIWCVDKRKGAIIAGPLLFSLGVNGFVKNIFKVARPIGLPGLRALRVHTATGYSFPSGHTQVATAFWGSLSIHYRNKAIRILTGIIIVLVGFSRLYLGVHWPSDVLGAIFIGTICVVGINSLYERAGYHRFIKVCIGIGIIGFLISIFFIKDKDYVSASGIFLGFYLGVLLENKYIQFHEKELVGVQIAKMAMGLTTLLFISKILGIILPQGPFFEGIYYIIIGIAVTYIVPMIFTKLIKKGKTFIR